MEQAIFAAGFNRLSNSKLVRLARGAIQGLHRLALEADARIHSVRTPGYPQNRTLTRSGSISLLLFLKREPQWTNRKKQ
jgi:hypothetical protein